MLSSPDFQIMIHKSEIILFLHLKEKQHDIV